MKMDPRYKLELLVVYCVTSTMAACGLLITASSAWMLNTGWAITILSACILVVPVYAAVTTYRELLEQIPGRSKAAQKEGETEAL